MSPPSEPDDRSFSIDVEKDGDLLREFVGESLELLSRVEMAALHIEENPSDRSSLHAMFAWLHTLKGSAGLLGLAPLRDLTHEIESLLARARDAGLVLTTSRVDLLLRGVDALKQAVLEIEKRIAPGAKASPIPMPVAGLVADIREALERPVEIEPRAEVAARRVASRTRHLEDQPMIRVDLRKFDALVGCIGKLAAANARVEKDVARVAQTKWRRELARLGSIVGELERAALALRLAPIRPTFLKMNRLVRDLAPRAGKQVQLVTRGDDTEMDRALVESLGAPLLHMVRNAIDHGIETPAERRAAGKPETGIIHLTASQKNSGVEVELGDDGAGLDARRIREHAVKRGLIAPDARMTDRELYNLIFVAGFSTAERVSDISGRGVGMDVVRDHIEKLRGRIEIRSAPGRGCAFLMALPLSPALAGGAAAERARKAR